MNMSIRDEIAAILIKKQTLVEQVDELEILIGKLAGKAYLEGCTDTESVLLGDKE
jgi:hypothetical protein